MARQIGKVLHIGQTLNVSKKDIPFYKRELVLDASRFDEYTGEKRENYVSFQFTQKRCEELDKFHVGDLVEVTYLLSGRPYEKDGQTKYITDIIGFNIELRGQQAKPQTQQQAVAVAPQQQSEPVEPHVDLPF